MKRMLLIHKAVPRWVILVIDTFIATWSFALSYLIISKFDFPDLLRGHFFIYTSFYGLTALIMFFSLRIHTGMLRYSNVHDMFRIFTSVLLTSILYPILAEFVISGVFSIRSLELGPVLLVNFFISSSLLIMLRTGVKGLYYSLKKISSNKKETVVIYGSDRNAILIKQALQSTTTSQFDIVAFIDTDKNKINSHIEQIPVCHVNQVGKLKRKKNVDKLILLNHQLGSADKQHVIDICLANGIKVVTVPPSEQWVYGKLSLGQMQDLKIEDLLQREPIVINNTEIANELTGKRILITGAAGSIGAEIVRQVLPYRPEMVILCDQAESALHEIQLEVEEKFAHANIKTFICSIREMNRLQIPFREFRPEIVFHAAAYKHVPMMENHPSEAVLTNILGTKNVADLSVLYHVEKFVMVSTDKAVNPTNIMGTSKRIAEMYVQSLNNVTGNNGYELSNTGEIVSDKSKSGTKFITTRFGNVLGSNGSVIPRFRSQIQNGGPITVTHPDITRYFMTIPEAVQLVLEAGTMGNGGEIFVFDMGKPVKIVDLALKMVRLAGLTEDRDIKIVYTGLRPGEKLYEELLNEQEKTIPTHHEKIKIAKVIPSAYSKVVGDVEDLRVLLEDEDDVQLVRKMKEMVPEFLSKNSKFEELDKPVLQANVLTA